MLIQRAILTDLSDILELQKTAYQSEAKLLNNFNIQPLTQTLTEIELEFHKGIFLKLITDENKIIGSVRGYTDQRTLYIGKLIVNPNYQGKGFGHLLLKAIEGLFPNYRYELFTSTMSKKNLSLYTKNGYKPYRIKEISNNLSLIFLEKQ